jgi:hypothetical protein
MPAPAQQVGAPTDLASHAVPTVTPEAVHVPLASPAFATTQLEPPTHAWVTPRSQLEPTPTVVTHVLFCAEQVMPRGHVTLVARSQPSPSLPFTVHRPQSVPTRSQTSVAHWPLTPHAAPPPAVPMIAHASVSDSMASGIGPELHALVLVASEAEQAWSHVWVRPLPEAARFVAQSAVREAVQAATLP